MPRLELNGVRFYYELHGPEGAPLVVLNNGILMNAASSWQLQTAALAPHVRVLLYDCRGQGLSDHPEAPYTMRLHADDLAALLDALRVDQAHVAGISYGGEVAQAFALSHPSRVASLILADTVSEVGPRLRRTIEEWREVARSADPDRFFDVTLPWNFTPEFVAQHPQLMEDARRRYALLDFPAVVRLCECFLSSVDFTAELSAIGAPTCVIVGERDILKDRSYSERIRGAIDGAELHVLAGAGHASCWERPREFNTVILGFLSKIAGLSRYH